MAKQSFTMLAHTYDSAKHCIQYVNREWFVSEKLDGMRAIWLGFDSFLGGPRLVSRYINTVHAPEAWLAQLPRGVCLDGELYSPSLSRQEIMSIVRRHVADARWDMIKYNVFEAPSQWEIMRKRSINEPNCKASIPGADCALERVLFRDKVSTIQGYENSVIHPVPQYKVTTIEEVLRYHETIADAGGEGVMIRRGDSYYETERSHYLLKVKKFFDSEGTVIGYTAGKGKLEGLIGAVVLRLSNGKVLELSGFTDEERALDTDIGTVAPGTRVPEGVNGVCIKIGDEIRFKYQDLSNEGVPQHARYWR